MERQKIINMIGEAFRTFGGGMVKSVGNPIAHALKDSPLQFAAGVDVGEVVDFVLFASDPMATPPDTGAPKDRKVEWALDTAAYCIKQFDGGDPATETGWKSAEMLEAWTVIQSLLPGSPSCATPSPSDADA